MGRPLLWATLAFATGIFAAERWPGDPVIVLLAGFGACTLCLFFLLADARSAIGASLFILAAFACLGALAGRMDPIHREADAAAQWEGRRVRVAAMVAGPTPSTINESVRLWLFEANGRSLHVPFTVLARLPAEGPRFSYGDIISLRGTINLPEEAGNPGEPSLRAALRRKGIAALLRVPPYASVSVVDRGSRYSPRRIALALRERMLAPLLALPPPYGGVLGGLLLGVEAGVPREIEDVFLRAGVLHVLVVSGAQVAIVAGAAVALAAIFRARRRQGALFAALAVCIFSILVGWSPSVGRATLMALVGLGAAVLGRDADAPTTLAVAALLWLAAHPASLFSLSFQLSFAATWGLLFLSPLFEPALRPRWLAQTISATFGAQLAVMPLLAAVFQQISLAAFAANLFVLPLVAVVVPAGFLLAVLGAVLPGLASVLVPVLLPPVWAILALARIFAAAPGAQIWLPPVIWWHVVLAYALLAFLPRLLVSRLGRLRIAAASAVLMVVVVLTPRAAQTLSGASLLVAVLDVGQGDAILVRSPAARTMLVDAGGEVATGSSRGRKHRDEHTETMHRDIGEERVVPALHRLGVASLDVVILSHAHEDHVGGLPAVLRHFPVGLVMDPGIPHKSPSYVRLLEMVRQRRIPYVIARAGQRIDLGGGTVVDVIAPESHPPARAPPEKLLNPFSVVARVRYGEVSFLLTGDIEERTEKQLLSRAAALQSTVLKVAHHGSKTSTRPRFLQAVKPELAVISVGRENMFGHPHAQTLRTLGAHRVRIYRTDLHGAVLMRTDGRNVTVQTIRSRPQD